MASKIWRKVPETIKISSSFETRISAAIDVYYCLVDINWLVMKSQYLVKKYDNNNSNNKIIIETIYIFTRNRNK